MAQNKLEVRCTCLWHWHFCIDTISLFCVVCHGQNDLCIMGMELSFFFISLACVICRGQDDVSFVCTQSFSSNFHGSYVFRITDIAKKFCLNGSFFSFHDTLRFLAFHKDLRRLLKKLRIIRQNVTKLLKFHLFFIQKSSWMLFFKNIIFYSNMDRHI